jgi:adenine-specific DNA-methyltransferase
MKKKIDYDQWSKDELIKEIKRIRETTYGLVWHRDLPEEKIDILINPDARTPSEMFPNEMAGKPFPVLKEVKSKAIEIDKGKPTNILIEGDNYHSLAVLNFTHQEAVDLIYIDPPYNTGKDDFVYTDKIKSEYVRTDDPFRHSKWISFMEKRLKLAKNLLKSTGVIFISIDDNEQAPLKLLCDEIFGSENFVGMFSVENNPKGRKNGKFISVTNEYCLIYVKRFDLATFRKIIPKHAMDMAEDEHGDFVRKSGKRVLMGENTLNKLVSNFKAPKHYSAYIKDSDLVLKQEQTLDDIDDELVKDGYKRYITFRDGQFVENTYTKEKFKELFDDESLDIREDKIYEKHFSDLMQIKSMLTNNEYEAIIDNKKVIYKIDLKTTSAKQQLAELLGREYFSFPKNVSFIKHLISLHPDTSATVLDFFAGSGTTGHAVLEMNSEDKGNRRFILCTNNENNICTEVCYPRITKVIKGYKNSNGVKVDGFGGNLKYFTAYDFVEAKETDRNKRKLVNESTEMLCIKEGAFELVQEAEDFKIFKNHNKYLGIIFHEDSISEYVKAIKKIDGHFNTYTFSMTDDPHTEEFSEVDKKVTLCAIPEVILKVYREIFKE